MSLFLPLVLAVTLGAEVPAAPGTRVVPAVYPQHDPDVATNGREFLAVWRDSRAGLYGSLRATRLHGEHALDPFGFEIADRIRSGQVASNGEAYLAAYTRTDGSAHAARIVDGRVTHRSHLGAGLVSDIASDGATYCVLAGDSAVITDAHGTVVATAPLPAPGEAVVARPGGGYRVFATVDDHVVMLPVTRNGLGEARRLQPAGGLRTVNAIAGRQQILVAWMPDSRIAYTVLDFDGNVIGAMRYLRYDPGSTRTRPSLGWDGREFLIGWASSSSMDAMRVGIDGAPQRAVADGLTTRPGATFGAAHDGRSTVVVTAEHLPSDALRTDVTARLIDSFAAYTTREPSVISSSGLPQQASALAAAGDGSALAVFTEETRLRASLRTPAGALQLLELAPPGWNAYISSVAAAGDVFLVVSYVQLSEPILQAWRVRSDGERLDRAPIAVPAAPYPSVPAVASDGARFLVVWAGERAVRGAFIGRDGSVGEPFAIAAAPSFSDVAVAWAGEAWLVSWHDEVAREYRAARLSPSGGLLGAPFTFATGQSAHAEPVVATDGEGALVVWDAWTDDGLCLYGAAFAADGTMRGARHTLVCDPQALAPISFEVTWDGAAYTLFWSLRDTELRTMRLTRSGFPFGDVAQIAVGLFGGSALVNGRILAFYSRVVNEEPYAGVLRVFLREIVPGEVPRRMRSTRP